MFANVFEGSSPAKTLCHVFRSLFQYATNASSVQILEPRNLYSNLAYSHWLRIGIRPELSKQIATEMCAIDLSTKHGFQFVSE